MNSKGCIAVVVATIGLVVVFGVLLGAGAHKWSARPIEIATTSPNVEAYAIRWRDLGRGQLSWDWEVVIELNNTSAHKYLRVYGVDLYSSTNSWLFLEQGEPAYILMRMNLTPPPGSPANYRPHFDLKKLVLSTRPYEPG